MFKRTGFANALMVVFLLGGLLSATSIKQELMPDMEERNVQVAVELSGASPDEIETSILVLIENAVRGLEGIKRVDAEAREGIGFVTVTLLESADSQQMLGDIKKAVDRITTFPQDAEEPVVTIPSVVEKALSIIVYGDQPLMWLRKTAESVRDDLRTRVGLTQVQLAFPREQEISVEISEDTLRQYGLSLEDVAGEIRESSPDLPGGTLFSTRADIALRTTERREWADEFSDVVITQTQEGIPVRLSDIAELKDGFGESPIETWFNGSPAIQIDVFAVGDETPISVGAAVREYLDTLAREMYQGVDMVVFENEAEAYRSRMALLIDNALVGLILVLVTLGLFLTPHLAFWVMIGIPTSLLGGLMLLPLFDATINMISLFAFIVTIGVVVDDAIMMGEAIYVQRTKGLDPLSAVVQGVKEMSGLVMLATSTTIIAFMPMFFVPGSMGDVFRQIPAVIVAVLLVSLVESLFILAAHLAKDRPERPWLARLARPQQMVNAGLELFIRGAFRNFMRVCLHRPGVLFASALSLLLITLGGIAGGLLGFSFAPTIESDTVIAQATLPYGTPKRQSIAVQQKLVEAANRVLHDNGMVSPGVFSLIGTRLEEGEVEVETLAGSHYISVLMALPPEGGRILSGREFARAWQDVFGEPGELEALNFTGETKVAGGEPLRLEVWHPDQTVARTAAIRLGEYLRACPGLTSVDDGIRAGKPELHLTLKDRGVRMGLTAEDMAKQVRHRYHGAEALRFVRDGSEVKVMVRLSEKERTGYGALEEVLLKSPSGDLIPLTQVADIAQTRSFTSLARRNGKRIYPVTADTMIGISDDVVEDVLEEKVLPALIAEFPDVSVGFGGEEEEVDESLGALGNGFLVVLGVMYLLLTLHYNSCIQPLLILSVIPFSFIGAVWGHILLGYDLSIISVLGIIATAGVVVNDSLVLVTTYNRYRTDGLNHHRAIVDAACQRFRPILLTSLTTFFGLMPLLLETSEQAQFLIPAAISISFGLVFGTVITLVLVPGLLWLFPKRGKQYSSSTKGVPGKQVDLAGT
jgi:multidrug efflux pump subunit AcrB